MPEETQSEKLSAATKSQKKSALVVGISTAFITSFAGSALNLAIPDLGSCFHMGAVTVGWIITIYMLVVAAFSVPFGKMADSTGRRRVLLVGTAAFGAASLLAVWAPNAAAILCIRVLQALGAAMIFATNMPIAMSAFPGSERGKVIGLVTSGTYTGLALGPVLGGVINTWLGWQAIFLFGALVSFFALLLTVHGLAREESVSARQKPDIGGNVLFMLMLAAIIYGLTVFNSVSCGWAFIVLGLVLGILFVRVELRAENPVIDVRIFASNRTYTLSNLTALFNYSATFAIGYLTSIYLQVVLGYSSQTAGLVLVAQPFFMALLSPQMGRISDRIAPYKLASAGMGLCALALLSFVFIKTTTPVWLIVLALSVAGIGIALFSSPNTNIIMSCVPPSRFGVANSILAAMRTTGQSTGMAIITLVVSGTVGNVSLYAVAAADLVRTVNVAFIIFTLLCVAGIFMSLQRRKR